MKEKVLVSVLPDVNAKLNWSALFLTLVALTAKVNSR